MTVHNCPTWLHHRHCTVAGCSLLAQYWPIPKIVVYISNLVTKTWPGAHSQVNLGMEVKYHYKNLVLKTHSGFTTTVLLCRTSKLAVASHTGGLGCVCTLTELIFGSLGHFHKLTVRSFTVQVSDLLPPCCTHHTPASPSILCRCAAGPGAAAVGLSSHQCLL